MESHKNPVNYLQEFTQKHNTTIPLPKYEESGISGPPHQRTFSCKCSYDMFEADGLGPTKKQAKTEAANNMIKLLESRDYFNRKVGRPKSENILPEIPLVEENAICLFDSKYQNHQKQLIEMNHREMTTKNPISLLQEYCVAARLSQPQYNNGGKIASGLFLTECRLDKTSTYGQGVTKKSAKTEAAFKMCQAFNLTPTNGSIIGDLDQDSVDDELSSYMKDLDLGKNYTSLLFEYCQENQVSVPKYSEINSIDSGFTYSCEVQGVQGLGTGSNKKTAKHNASMNVYKKLQQNPEIMKHIPRSHESKSNIKIEELDLEQEEYGVSSFLQPSENVGSVTGAPDVGEEEEDAGVRLQQKFLQNKVEAPRTLEKKLPENHKIATLEEFNLSEDDDEEKNAAENYALNLNDSVVEIEPNSEK